jgi:hypothetical protein
MTADSRSRGDAEDAARLQAQLREVAEHTMRLREIAVAD